MALGMPYRSIQGVVFEDLALVLARRDVAEEIGGERHAFACRRVRAVS